MLTPSLSFSQDIDLKTLCDEKGNCYEVLGEEAKILGVNWLKILEALERNIPKVAKTREEFKEQLKEEIERCHQKRISLKLQNARELKLSSVSAIGKQLKFTKDWWADAAINRVWGRYSTARKIEETAKRIFEGAKEAFFSEAEDNELKDLFTEKEIKAIALEIAKQHYPISDPSENSLEVRKESYIRFTQEVISKIFKSRGMEDKGLQLSRLAVVEFRACLSKAQSEEDIKTCLEQFQKVAAYRVGQIILDEMIKEKFQAFDSATHPLALKRKEAKKAFDGCASKWFYSGQPKDDGDISACVYEGILKSLNGTLEDQLRFNLQESGYKGSKEDELLAQIYKNYNCSLKDQIKRAGYLKASDYEAFLTVTSTALTEKIESCTDAVTFQAVKTILTEKTKGLLEDQQKLNEILKVNLEGYKECIVENASKDNKNEICVKRLTRDTYEKISIAIMKGIIDAQIPEGEAKADALRLVASTNKQCLDLGLKKQNPEMHFNGCVANTAFVLSDQIGSYATGEFYAVLGGAKDPAQMKAALESILSSEKEEVTTDDPGLKAFAKFQTCLNKVKRDATKKSKNLLGFRKKELERSLTNSDFDLNRVTEGIKACGTELEQESIAQVKEHFRTMEVAGKRPEFQPAFNTMSELIMLLRGKESTTDGRGESGVPEVRLDEQLRSLALLISDGCQYDVQSCEELSSQAYDRIEKFRAENPEATSDELILAFKGSDFIELVAKATISKTLNEKFLEKTVDYQDEEGVLLNAIRKIASKELLDPLFKSPKGQELLSFIRAEVKAGNEATLGDNPKLRSMVVNLLLSDDGEDGFVDVLIEGFSQPKLTEKVETAGPFLKFASWIHIARFENFDWSRIKQTKDGKAARKYFGEQILGAYMRDEEVSEQEMEKRMKKLEKMIKAAIVFYKKDHPTGATPKKPDGP